MIKTKVEFPIISLIGKILEAVCKRYRKFLIG